MNRLGFHPANDNVQGATSMANEKKRGNRETKKPKKAVSKVIAAAPSTKNIVSTTVRSATR